MKKNKFRTNVLFKKRVVSLKKNNKFLLRYYLYSYNLNKSSIMFKKYYDIFFKIHYPYLKKINTFVLKNLTFKIFFKKIFFEQNCFLYGNVEKFLYNYKHDNIDQYFYKIDFKKFNSSVSNYFGKNSMSMLKSNLFIHKDMDLLVEVDTENISDFFFKGVLTKGYLNINHNNLPNKINFEFIFQTNMLYFFEIYSIHKTVILTFIK